MNYWIVPSNDNVFRIADAIKANNGIVDWRQSNNFAVGDIVFIYKGKPEQRVAFRMEVIGVEIKEEDALDQEKFWTDQLAYFDGLGQSNYVRFKLLEEILDDAMSLQQLHAHGFNGYIQSVQHCPEEAIEFMLNPYGTDNSEDYDVDYPADNEELYEGALMEVKVNKYERNRKAREKCIELKGRKCLVCGRDFEETYGDIGKGFIHVHHLVPISSIGKEYQLDVEKDLAPVCPNCHYMLHRKNPPYTIEELQRMMQGTEDNPTPIAAEPVEIRPLPNYFYGCIPLYDLKAACGSFSENEIPEEEGWIDVRGYDFKPDPKRYFAIHAKGNSMFPKISDGDICVFKRYDGGSRDGKTVLIQCNGIDPDTECNYTIKDYHSEKAVYEDEWHQESITLSPINKKYDDIHLDPSERYVTIGIFECKLNK